MAIRLWCLFRSQGVQWPLRPGDQVEIRDDNMDSLGVLEADLVIEIIQHHLTGVLLQKMVGDQVNTSTVRKPLRKADVAPPALQASRRASRRHSKKLMWASLALLAQACGHDPAWFFHDGGAKYGPFADKAACESVRKFQATVSYTVSPCYTNEGISP